MGITKIVTISMLIILILGGASAVYYSIKYPDRNIVGYLSGLSTFAIAVLTVIYVITTSRHLDVTTKQLIEMEKDREFEHQPLPWLIDIGFEVNKPELFTFPELAPLARYHASLKIKNIGSSSAVSVDICPSITFIKGEKKKRISSVSERVDVVEEKSTALEGENIDFIFSTDDNADFLHSFLADDLEEFPKLVIAIFFRNIIGGCFQLVNEYLILPKDSKQYSYIKSWLKSIRTFNIDFEEEIKTIALAEREKIQIDLDTEAIIAKFEDSIVGETIRLRLWAIPGAATIKPIEKGEYKKLTKQVSYAHLCPPHVFTEIKGS